jgi:alpha-beta hydrolase superfamily lysophospholipase
LKKKILIAFLATLLLLIGSQIHFDVPAADIERTWALPESKFLDLNGMRVHYTDEGKGENVVLVHGTAASLHTWREWVKTLKKDFRVVTLDLPAFGLTGPSPDNDYTIPNYVKFLEQVLCRDENAPAEPRRQLARRADRLALRGSAP